ncbi:hypothetical protein BGX28_006306 [Mortierella sp. GBA30]|nr:hypothetical protein BGX28_006306 [Mortierella sp. GBA30]
MAFSFGRDRARTNPSPTLRHSRLVRTHTPVPGSFLSSPAPQDTLAAQTSSNTLMNRNMLQLHTSLFQDLAQDEDEDEDISDEDKDTQGRIEASDGEQEDSDDDDDNAGREQTNSVANLSALDPSDSATAPPNDTPTLALQADKRSKRVRVDPSARSPVKKVRFDESKNTVHEHHRSSSISPPCSPQRIPLFTTRPLVPALSRRQSETGSSERFSLSLENTSQEVMDFASSLTRLMGGGGGSPDLESSASSPLPSQRQRSPLSSFSTFKASPPSPIRPSFMSYSPPPSSSLSSSWSPSFDDDNDDEDASMDGRRLSPTRPTLQDSPSSSTFTPRRPRVPSNLSPTRPQDSTTTPSRPRFPAMLKREASNASFLDSYPTSLQPEASSAATDSAMPLRERSPSTFTPRRPRMSNSAQRSNAPLARPRLPAMLKREASHASFLDSYPASLAPEQQPMQEQQHRLTTPPRETSTSPIVTIVPTLRKCLSDLSANASQLPMIAGTAGGGGGVPQLKRSRSFSEDEYKKPSASKVLPSFLPRRPADVTMSLLATPPDSQLV